ncbi:hypothetical protein Leryth_022325 [Lithospermum erythrorhizon]|uniref:Non-receptor serine/threonine protein kinase n=1 Tax=Lithospermum erythrorhizon TaxID=34254 RepID=A0AAV3R9G6_LITER|nr:hypothetical protein Leryth_022325 [Lithospermum erythrorhizon]
MDKSINYGEENAGSESSSSTDNGYMHIEEFSIVDKFLINICDLNVGPVIGGSGYSTVYQGEYKSMPVAVKVVQPENSANVSPERKERYLREVVMLARVQHENIVKFIGAATEPSLMIITELMGGGSLQKHLWSIRPNCLDYKLAVNFALSMSLAMEYLHSQGIIHRDLKPSNILLSEDKNSIKLADFGLSREETSDEMTTEAGTYRWMAPEMFSAQPMKVGVKKHYDHKVDVYSFSLILWEMITNSTPFKGRTSILVAYAASSRNLRPSIEKIPEEIVPLLQSCWSNNPKERPEFSQISSILVNILNNRNEEAPMMNPNLFEEKEDSTVQETRKSPARSNGKVAVVHDESEYMKQKSCSEICTIL